MIKTQTELVQRAAVVAEVVLLCAGLQKSNGNYDNIIIIIFVEN
jgi:hypothetical protein